MGKGMRGVTRRQGARTAFLGSRHQIPTSSTTHQSLTPRAAAGRAPTQTHARAPRPRARTRPKAPAAAAGTRAVLAAPTPLPPLGSRRLRLPAPLHAGPADSEAAAVVGGLRRAQRFRRRLQERDVAEPDEFPGGDVARRGPLRKAGAATGQPVRRRRGRPRQSARTRHGLRHVLAEQVQ